jgi:hypothetical protein
MARMREATTRREERENGRERMEERNSPTDLDQETEGE